MSSSFTIDGESFAFSEAEAVSINKGRENVLGDAVHISNGKSYNGMIFGYKIPKNETEAYTIINSSSVLGYNVCFKFCDFIRIAS